MLSTHARLAVLFALAFIAFGILLPAPTSGRQPPEVERTVFPGHTFDPELLTAPSAVLLDINTGMILFDKEVEEAYAPASLVKIATLALTYAAIDEGRASRDDTVTVSEKAWAAVVPGSKMFIEVGDEVSLGTLMEGMIVASGNDACIAIAEHLAGSEDRFIGWMNDLAGDLGLDDTVFGSVHGLPAEGQVITPWDVARLVRHFCLTYPQAQEITTQTSFTYGGISQPNRNQLVARDPRVTGLKTGRTFDSGFHLVATAQDGDEHYAAIVMGIGAGEDMADETGAQLREADASMLLDWAFEEFARVTVDLGRKIPETVTVYKGREREVAVRVEPPEPVITAPAVAEDRIEVRVSIEDVSIAPLSRSDTVGTAAAYWLPNAESNGEEILLGRWDIHPTEDIEAGNWWRRLWDSVILLFRGLVS